MSESLDQSQKGGMGSTNLQVGKIEIAHHGLSYTDVRAIALDIFDNNFRKLSTVAAETARNRATEILDDFMVKLQDRYPEGLKQAEDPDFQLGLYTVQREYARTGNEDLGKLLVDILIERSKQEERNILQIVLNESLAVAPKLTEKELSALAIIFALRFMTGPGVNSLDLLKDYLLKVAAPFAPHLTKNLACYQHLEFASCATISLGEIQLDQCLRNAYSGLFSNGFDSPEREQQVPELTGSPIVIPCLNEPTKFQFNALNKGVLDSELERLAFPPDVRARAQALAEAKAMSPDQFRDKVCGLVPEMNQVYDVWLNSQMKSLNLTSVGIALAHSYLRSKTDLNVNLALWIN